MTMLVMLYGCILALQFFTIGGVLLEHRTFKMWASAIHLGVIVCFFWTLIINALIHLTMDLTGQHHQGRGTGLFFLTIIFPVIAVLLYAVLVTAVVYRKLDRYGALTLLFLASPKIAKSTHGRINGSMFSTLLDMLSVVLVYKFWQKITDDTWGDCTV
ncbi:MAG: hypothetical protein J3Q66DRAFT_385870 [Benniella sp.]|nr:MAG: hypothetical protein J3Q66DRAFT_385870 [Benniella sp.]